MLILAQAVTQSRDLTWRGHNAAPSGRRRIAAHVDTPTCRMGPQDTSRREDIAAAPCVSVFSGLAVDHTHKARTLRCTLVYPLASFCVLAQCQHEPSDPPPSLRLARRRRFACAGSTATKPARVSGVPRCARRARAKIAASFLPLDAQTLGRWKTCAA
ncbi:hypothetical protein BKA93DRAFT_141896 [Sparassis latifolia]